MKGRSCNFIIFPGGGCGHFIGCLIHSLMYRSPINIHPKLGNCHHNELLYLSLYKKNNKILYHRFKKNIFDISFICHLTSTIDYLQANLQIINEKFERYNIISIEVFDEHRAKASALYGLKSEPFKKTNLKTYKEIINSKYYHQVKNRESYLPVFKKKIEQLNSTFKENKNTFYYSIDFNDLFMSPKKVLNQLSVITGKEITQYEKDKYAEYLWVNKALWNKFIPYASFWTSNIKKEYI